MTTESNEEDSGKSEGGFGKFGKATSKGEGSLIAEPTSGVEQLMGCKGFGNGKIPWAFNVESLVEQSKQFARTLATEKISAETSLEMSNGEFGGPHLPPAEPRLLILMVMKKLIVSKMNNA